MQLLAASLARARGEDFFPCSPNISARRCARARRDLRVGRRAPRPHPGGLAAGRRRPELRLRPRRNSLRARVRGRTAAGRRRRRERFPTRRRAGEPTSACRSRPRMARCSVTCARGSIGPSTMSAEQRAICDVLANRAAAELRLVHVKRERALLRAQRRSCARKSPPTHDVQDVVGTGEAHRHLLDEVRRIAARGRQRAGERRTRHRQGAGRARHSRRGRARHQALHTHRLHAAA